MNDFSSKHFEGKSAAKHLKDARKKGSLASNETHGIEPSGALIAACDSAKEITCYLFFLFIILGFSSVSIKAIVTALSLFSIGFIIWKTARSAYLGWSRLERIHRLIKQEHWEITHHRDQEKEELKEMYAAKGFKGQLLDDVVEVLMADDNRLLMVMLEEELGLSLESVEHPLRQALGALIGSMISCAFITLMTAFFKFPGIIIASFITTFIASLIMTKRLKNDLVKSIVWSLAIALVSIGAVYFLFPIFINTKTF